MEESKVAATAPKQNDSARLSEKMIRALANDSVSELIELAKKEPPKPR